jgi:hypothetical protein
MKRIVVIFLVLLWTGFISAKLSVAEKPMDPMNTEAWTLNFGIGPGIMYYGGYSAGFGPAFQVAVEKGMWQLGPGVLTLGGEFGFSYFHKSFADYRIGNVYYNGPSYTWLSFIIAARSAYHYGWKISGLDTYGGVSLGPRFLAFTAKDNVHNYYGNYSPGSVGFFGGVFLGGSYFFTSKIGVNLETGYNVTPIQIGMVFKLN